MSTETDARTSDGVEPYAWLTGVAGGLAAAVVTGLVIQFGFDPTVLSSGIPGGFGLSGLVSGWAIFLVLGAVFGAVYAGFARAAHLRERAALPGPGVALGLGYGLVLWVLAVVVVPLWLGGGLADVGTYAVTLRGVVAFALLGTIIGLVYGVSPYTG